MKDTPWTRDKYTNKDNQQTGTKSTTSEYKSRISKLIQLLII